MATECMVTDNNSVLLSRYRVGQLTHWLTLTNSFLPVVVVAEAGVEQTGTLLFIFSTSNSGLEDEDGGTVALLGLGSRLMTGTVEMDVVGRGAARRVLRAVVGQGLKGAESGVGATLSDSGSDP